MPAKEGKSSGGAKSGEQGQCRTVSKLQSWVAASKYTATVHWPIFYRPTGTSGTCTLLSLGSNNVQQHPCWYMTFTANLSLNSIFCLFVCVKTYSLIHFNPQEARHPRALPVCGHGGCSAVCQLHVVWGEEEVVCDGCRHTARHQHVRVVRRRAGALQRLA